MVSLVPRTVSKSTSYNLLISYNLFASMITYSSLISACFRGEVINGGFGLVLDGSDEAALKAESMLNWDVSNGVARR